MLKRYLIIFIGMIIILTTVKLYDRIILPGGAVLRLSDNKIVSWQEAFKSHTELYSSIQTKYNTVNTQSEKKQRRQLVTGKIKCMINKGSFQNLNGIITLV